MGPPVEGEGREGDSTALVMEKAESPWRLAPCVCVCVCVCRAPAVSVRATYPHT
jgi:hypothetical protein